MSHWIREFPRDKCQTFLCSECGRKVYYIDGSARGKYPGKSKCYYPFCPHCKATMDGRNTEMKSVEVEE